MGLCFVQRLILSTTDAFPQLDINNASHPRDYFHDNVVLPVNNIIPSKNYYILCSKYQNVLSGCRPACVRYSTLILSVSGIPNGTNLGNYISNNFTIEYR